MRAVVQRVSGAAVTIDGKVAAEIQKGILILLGIEESDDLDDVDWLAGKISRLRIFADEMGLMNLSLKEIDGEAIVVSQFTLHASTKKGNRPSYIRAAGPETAIPLYHDFIQAMEVHLNKSVGTGEFGAMMQVSLVNDGPITIIIDSKKRE